MANDITESISPSKAIERDLKQPHLFLPYGIYILLLINLIALFLVPSYGSVFTDLMMDIVWNNRYAISFICTVYFICALIISTQKKTLFRYKSLEYFVACIFFLFCAVVSFLFKAVLSFAPVMAYAGLLILIALCFSSAVKRVVGIILGLLLPYLSFVIYVGDKT